MLDSPSKGRGGSGGGGGTSFAGSSIAEGNLQGFLESLHGQVMLRLDQMALQQAEQSKQVMDRLEEMVSSAINTKSMYGTNSANGALFRQSPSNNDFSGRISPDALANTLGKNRNASPSRLELKRLNSQSPDSPVRGAAAAAAGTPSASAMAAAAANELLGGDATWSPWSPGGTNQLNHRVQPQKQAVASHGASPPFLDEGEGSLEDSILADVEKTRCFPASPSEQSGAANTAWASPRTAGGESKQGVREVQPRDPPLFVTIRSAKNLRNSRGMPANDPFCICRARGGTEFRSHPRRDTTDTLNPIWECEVVLDEYSWGENIEFLVYDDLSNIGGTKEMLCSAVLTPDRFCGEGRPSTFTVVSFSGELPLLRPRTNFESGSTISVAVTMDAAEPSSGEARGMIEVPSAEEEKTTWRFRGLRTLSTAAARMVDSNTASAT